jgi:hypothetical protein
MHTDKDEDDGARGETPLRQAGTIFSSGYARRPRKVALMIDPTAAIMANVPGREAVGTPMACLPVQAQEGQGTVRSGEWPPDSRACSPYKTTLPPALSPTRRAAARNHPGKMTT